MPRKASERPELLGALNQALRRFSDQDVLFSQAVADRLGINLTDLKCASILEQSGPLAAGRLAELTGLTTGAITGVVDRLEKAGYARRVKDPRDRRVVILEATHTKGSDWETVVGSLRGELGALCEGYAEKELLAIVDFVRRSGELLRDETTKLRAATAPREPRTGGEFAALLGTLTHAQLKFASGASRVELTGGTEPDQLCRATFEGRAPTFRVQGGVVRVTYPHFSLFDWGRLAGRVALSDAVLWQLEFHGGISKLTAELGALRIESIDLTGGVSDVLLVLPHPEGTVPIRVSGGVSQVTLRRPAGVAVRAQVSGGASKLALDANRFGSIGGHSRLETPDYPGATDRYDVDVSGGASNLIIETTS